MLRGSSAACGDYNLFTAPLRLQSVHFLVGAQALTDLGEPEQIIDADLFRARCHLGGPLRPVKRPLLYLLLGGFRLCFGVSA